LHESEKQKIFTKSSTEAELVALSDSCNQGLHVRRFLQAQGCQTAAVTVYQDNLSCMAMVAEGSPLKRKRNTQTSDTSGYNSVWMKEK
jgi:hypothetical protein